MTSETGKTTEPAAGQEPESPPTAARDGLPVLPVMALGLSLLALMAAIAAGYQALGLQDRLPDTAPLQARLDSADERTAQLGSRIVDLQAELDVIRRQQEAMLASLTALRDPGSYTLDSVLVETENLLVIATQRLTLSHDVATALAAMESVEDRLRNINDPLLIQFRQVLTADITSLRNVETVDITGLTLYLADIAARVESLPLKDLVTATDAPDDAAGGEEADADTSLFSRLGDEVLETLKDLVKVYPTAGGEVIALLPEQRYYLFQNLRLQLEIARLAVMRGETRNFQASLENVNNWLQTYFDTTDRAVANILSSLSGMGTLDLDPPLPDISSSMESLRSIIHRRAEAGGDDAAATGTGPE